MIVYPRNDHSVRQSRWNRKIVLQFLRRLSLSMSEVVMVEIPREATDDDNAVDEDDEGQEMDIGD